LSLAICFSLIGTKWKFGQAAVLLSLLIRHLRLLEALSSLLFTHLFAHNSDLFGEEFCTSKNVSAPLQLISAAFSIKFGEPRNQEALSAPLNSCLIFHRQIVRHLELVPSVQKDKLFVREECTERWDR
jgi:hypothetical protein